MQMGGEMKKKNEGESKAGFWSCIVFSLALLCVGDLGAAAAYSAAAIVIATIGK
jgi:hypothetical protein